MSKKPKVRQRGKSGRARLEGLSQAGHTQWRGWYLDQQAPVTKRAVHSVDAILRGVMGMGT